MDKKAIKEFFDACAVNWDSNQVRNDKVIKKILDNAGIGENMDVLDVACGTGVLFPDYLSRNVNSVCGIDISDEMIKRASEKYLSYDKINLICGDVECTQFDKSFDAIVVYNAFPHFPNPENLISVLCSVLKTDGILTIAHGMSKADVDNHHKGPAHHVSIGLMEIEALKLIMSKFLSVTVSVSNSEMYQIVGIKRHD